MNEDCDQCHGSGWIEDEAPDSKTNIARRYARRVVLSQNISRCLACNKFATDEEAQAAAAN